MKKCLSALLTLVFLACIFQSCTIHKRLHQPGFQLSWNTISLPHNKVETPEKINEKEISFTTNDTANADSKNHSPWILAYDSEQLILQPEVKLNLTEYQDTITPQTENHSEEYFDKRSPPVYTPNPNQSNQGKHEANIVLVCGLAAITSPLWLYLVGSVAGLYLAGLSIATIILVLLLSFLILTVLSLVAIIAGIHFLTKYGKEGAQLKYRKRAIVGLILASIIPALLIFAMLSSLVLI